MATPQQLLEGSCSFSPPGDILTVVQFVASVFLSFPHLTVLNLSSCRDCVAETAN